MSQSTSQQGFSLVELLIAMAISSVVMAGVYNMFYTQQRSYTTQEQVAEMQQNLRAAMQLMSREIRSAGFDPGQTGRFSRLVTDFPSPNNIFSPDIDYATQHKVIAFTMDNSEDGILQANNNEMIAYRLNNRTLERYYVQQATWLPLADNIDALDFVYLDQNGTPTSVIADIRAVEISLLVRTNKDDSKYKDTASTYYNKQGQSICSACGNDKYRRRLLTTTVYFRN